MKLKKINKMLLLVALMSGILLSGTSTSAVQYPLEEGENEVIIASDDAGVREDAHFVKFADLVEEDDIDIEYRLTVEFNDSIEIYCNSRCINEDSGEQMSEYKIWEASEIVILLGTGEEYYDESRGLYLISIVFSAVNFNVPDVLFRYEIEEVKGFFGRLNILSLTTAITSIAVLVIVRRRKSSVE